jgi:hypothetical protein
MAKPTSIADINANYTYEDTTAGGKADAPLVSCGQHGGYNELGNILKVKLQPYIDSGKITKQAALNALSECCEEIENPRKREDFYAALTEKLGVTIK